MVTDQLSLRLTASSNRPNAREGITTYLSVMIESI